MSRKRKTEAIASQPDFWGDDATIEVECPPVEELDFMKPVSDLDYCGVSFGAGVQSTAILLLLNHEPERLQDAVGHLPEQLYFADTQSEHSATYQHLGRLMVEGMFKRFPLTVVSAGNLAQNELETVGNRSLVPYFTKMKAQGPLHSRDVGKLARKCTSEYKIDPLHKAFRAAAGLVPYQRARPRSIGVWIGISMDEIQRATVPEEKWARNIYPLIALGWSRSDCYQYCVDHGFYPPKSRCYMCPYIQDWRSIQELMPEEFGRAVEFDSKIRRIESRGTTHPTYIHRSCKPLKEAVAQQQSIEWDDFADECQGYCGL